MRPTTHVACATWGHPEKLFTASKVWCGFYVAKARTLDHEHSRQADGTRYPGVREQVQGHLVGPVLAALRAWDPVIGLAVGSYQ